MLSKKTKEAKCSNLKLWKEAKFSNLESNSVKVFLLTISKKTKFSTLKFERGKILLFANQTITIPQ